MAFKKIRLDYISVINTRETLILQAPTNFNVIPEMSIPFEKFILSIIFNSRLSDNNYRKTLITPLVNFAKFGTRNFFQKKKELRNISKKQILYVDKEKKLKECSICHQILHYDKFFLVSKNSLNVRPYCKKCSSDLGLIIQNRKKLKLIINHFNGKCSKCSSDILILPALQFHHPNPQKKNFSWKDIRGRSYNYIVHHLKRENVILLCVNCHLKEQALILQKYRNLILQKNLFEFAPEEINNQILKETEKIIKKLDRSHVRAKIRSWIKKRYVLGQVFGGKCLGCGNPNLHALAIHHLDPLIERKIKMEALRKHRL